MKSFRWRSLSLQMILAVLLPLTVGAILLIIYSQTLHHAAMEQMVGERNLRTVRVLADEIQSDLSNNGSASMTEVLDQVFLPVVNPGLVSIQIYDSNHNLIYEAGRSPVESHAAYHPGVLAGLERESGVIYPMTGHQPGQGAHVVAFAPIPSTSWVLVMDEAWEDVSSEQLKNSQNAPFILIPFILLAFGALFLILRQVVIPLQKLEKQTQALGQGDYSALARSVGGIDEVRSLQQRMAEMAGTLNQARQNLQGYIGSITRGVEEERLRIARELHDQPLQSLIALKHRIQTKPAEGLGMATGSIQQVIDDLRGLVRGLRPQILEDLGLTAALENLITRTDHQTQLQIDLQISGIETRQTPEVELVFFRIAQEGLINIHKHANATNAEVILEYLPMSMVMHIHDNGQGFTVPDRIDLMAENGHYGLIGIMERAALIDAEVQIKSQPGIGTDVWIIYRYPQSGEMAGNKPETDAPRT